METYKFMTDVRIAKQRRRHLLATHDDKVVSWHDTVGSALAWALDAGVTTLVVEADEGDFQIEVVRVDPAEENP